MDRSAGIVIIGDEILSGKFHDENARFLIGELRPLGVTLSRISIIPDDPEDIADTVRRFSDRFDYVFTSGGVGPTHDDVTMSGIAAAFGTRVVVHETLEDKLHEVLGDRMTDAHRRLAEVPEGADLVVGEGSSWPVVAYRNVYILPGVPQIFRSKFQSIRGRFRSTPFVLGRLYCTCDESRLAHHLTETVEAFPEVKFGSYPRYEETAFQVVVTVESKDEGRAREAFAHLRGRVAEVLHRAEEPAPPGDAPAPDG